MKNQANTTLKDLLFKPVVLSTTTGPRLMIIYGHDVIIEHTVGSSGELVKNRKESIKLLDVSRTVEFGHATIEVLNIEDHNKVLEKIKTIDTSECSHDILLATSMLIEEMTMLTDRLNNMSNALSAIKKISETQEESNNFDSGNLILAGSSEPLTHIVFETITGEKVNLHDVLSEQDIRNIGGVLLDIVMSHVDQDLENQDFLKKLLAEIEYKLIEALPSGLKAGDININLNAVVAEIKKFRDLDHTDMEQE